MINLLRCAPVVLAVLAGAGSALAQTSIWVDPAAVANKELGTGSMVAVTARCSGLEEVRAIRFLLEYDPEVLEFLWYDTGDFALLEIPGSIPGTFDYSGARADAATGDFSIATMHFMVKKVGHTVLKMTGSPFEEYPDPVYVDNDYVEFPFGSWRDGFFSNDGTEPPVSESKIKPPTATPDPSASAESAAGGRKSACSAGARPAMPWCFLAVATLALRILKRTE